MAQHRFYVDIEEEYNYSQLPEMQRLKINKKLRKEFREMVNRDK